MRTWSYLPPHVRNLETIVVAEAKRHDGSRFTDAFNTLDEARDALLQRAWISADFYVWAAQAAEPLKVFMVHADEAAAWGRRRA